MSNPNPVTKHLKPFQKGQSGNPKGRPKMPDLKKLLSKVMGEKKEGLLAAEAMLKAMRGKAMKGDVRAAEFLFHYAYGRPNQTLDITTDGQPIQASHHHVIEVIDGKTGAVISLGDLTKDQDIEK